MKITFKTPLKPWIGSNSKQESNLNLIICPRCGSDDVGAYTLVHGYAYVNVNTGVVEELPSQCECSVSDARSESKYTCFKCKHDWNVEKQ